MDPQAKFERHQAETLYSYLPRARQAFVERLAIDYRLTRQELRLLCEAARDLEQWQEMPLEDWWADAERRTSASALPERKARILADLHSWLDAWRAAPTRYAENGVEAQRVARGRQVERSDRRIFGTCPVFSEETLCCGLQTIDTVRNCGFGCSYCSVQTFGGEQITFDADLAEKLKAIELEPERSYHIGTGLASDSLMWGNYNGLLDDLMDFARARPNVLLELKTKACNTAYFETHGAPSNVVVSWSLNPDTIIRNEEHFAPLLDERLAAAERLVAAGVAVAFHFHPLVHYHGWRREYEAAAASLRARFSPEDVLFVSFGALTLTRPAIRSIRQKQQHTKVLQMPMVPAAKGKFSYPDEVKVEMFRALYAAFAGWDVYTYICMERADLWHRSLGFSYADNGEFEAEFARRVKAKLSRRERVGGVAQPCPTPLDTTAPEKVPANR